MCYNIIFYCMRKLKNVCFELIVKIYVVYAQHFVALLDIFEKKNDKNHPYFVAEPRRGVGDVFLKTIFPQKLLPKHSISEKMFPNKFDFPKIIFSINLISKKYFLRSFNFWSILNSERNQTESYGFHKDVIFVCLCLYHLENYMYAGSHCSILGAARIF